MNKTEERRVKKNNKERKKKENEPNPLGIHLFFVSLFFSPPLGIFIKKKKKKFDFNFFFFNFSQN